MTLVNHHTPDDQDWLSVSALADERGVSRQTISERVRKLAAQGSLTTRGERKQLRVHAPTFRRLIEQQHDPAQDMRLRRVKSGLLHDIDQRHVPAQPRQTAAVDSADVREQETYDEAATREKNAKADLAEMEAKRRRGELVQSREFEAAAVEVGTRVAQTINALRSQVTPLYAAAQAGEDALHAALNIAIDNALRQIADDMAAIAQKAMDNPALD